ncbi:autotransporter outer membrane beta-barrel domain-containing protein [Leminorella grimontii]|nr:autotransporter outer membrane beta-barrel domain-containing protein [Leminorella grimontii]KFC95468.1 autotransporter [Leminorella grimontii ATCC 33999 = DSM 5078]VFS60459.1 AIDA-I autotransporter precursor [Leminorella grimontii]
MNRNYNIVWNAARSMHVVASELACGDSRIPSRVRAAGVAVGLVLSGMGYASAAEVGPQSGASVALQNGDTVTVTTGGTGINSTVTGGSGLRIDGKATINVSGDSGSSGVKLDNSASNELGVGTEIHVTDTGTSTSASTTGLYIDKNNAGTHVNADGLVVDVSAAKSAYGIFSVGSGDAISLGKGSSITAKSDTSIARGVYLSNSNGSFSIDGGFIRAETAAADQATGLSAEFSDRADITLGKGTRIEAESALGSSTGVAMGSNGTLTGEGVEVSVKGANTTYGVTVGSGSTVDFGKGSSINMQGNASYSTGIYTGGTNSSFIADGISLNMETTRTGSSTGRGIEVYGEGASVDLGSGSTVSVHGYTAGGGITLTGRDSGYAPVSFKADRLTVDVTGKGVNGIQVDGGTMDLGSGSSVSANGTVETIWVTDGELKAKELTVKTAQSTGILAQGGTVTIGEGSVIDGRIVGASGSTNGIAAGYKGFGNETATVNFNGTEQNRNTIYGMNGYGASSQFAGQTVNISNTDIVMGGTSRSYGLWAIGNYSFTQAGVINAKNVAIDMTSLGANGYGVVVQQGGIVNLTGDTTIKTDGGVAIWNPRVGSSSDPDVVYQGGTITGTGKMDITGDIVNSGWGTIDLTMDAGSLFTGATSVNAALGDDSTLNLALENRAQWTMTSSSSLSNLTNGGSIVSGGATPGSTLSVSGDYVGNGGTLTLNTQLDGDDSLTDRLVVNGNTSGTTTLMVNNVGGQGALTTNGIEVVNVSGSSDGEFTQGNRLQAGLFEYRLYKDGANWYLRSLAVDPTPTPDPDIDPDVDPVTPQYRPDIGAFVGNQAMMKNLQMQTLYDREGSQYQSKDGAVWMRFKAGMADSTAANGNVDIDNHYSQIQLGGDLAAWRLSEQSLNVGVMGSYVKADTDSKGNRGADGSRFSATGSVDGYNLGVYATWFANAQSHQGLYVDSWYQYGMYDNTVSNAGLSSANYDSTANAVSLETGYRHDVAIGEGRTLSLIPQAQIVWQNYRADAVNVDGTRVDGQNGDGWTSRLGLRVTGKMDKGQNVIQPFLEANWLHSTDDVSVSYDGASVKQDLPADRAELKAGIQANFGSQWSVAAQAVGQKGSHGYGDASFGLNVRYSW